MVSGPQAFIPLPAPESYLTMLTRRCRYIKHGNNIEKARKALRRVRDSEQDVEN